MNMAVLTFLEWFIIAASFFNTIVLLWLGLTVLLNAERRVWGTWIVGVGLTCGGLFFAGHAAAIVWTPSLTGASLIGIELWWRIIWLPVIGGPYVWYLVMAWYTGVLRTRLHRAWLSVATIVGGIALVSQVISTPLIDYRQIVYSGTPTTFSNLISIPVVSLMYPAYSILCILLALFALRHPESSERFMGDLGRQRARPWLTVASLVLLGLSVFVGGVSAWFLWSLDVGTLDLGSFDTLLLSRSIDAIVCLLLAFAIVLIGQAIVAYEIFTGKVLPRGGLTQQWRRSLILAIGYGTVMSASLQLQINPVYQLLLATCLMTLFFALLCWRSFAERESGINNLRPFVASQHLYDRLLHPTLPHVDVASSFHALCDEILGTHVAHLHALGPLASLVGHLHYPVSTSDTDNLSYAIADLVQQLYSPQTMCIPLQPEQYGGAVWAIPLWSERGLIGVLLVGEKHDGGLYTQEEIEIARATAERLIDTQGSAEMARRLMVLQRQRLSESQVVDQRTRRILHDDVLPRLHTTMLMIGNTPQSQEIVTALSGIHRQIADLLHIMPTTSASDVTRLGLVGALRRAVEYELSQDFDGVTWMIDSATEEYLQSIPALAAEVMFYAAREAIRNAARHGRNGDSTRSLHLRVSAIWQDGLQVQIEDDGIGFGATDSTVASSGQGLALHSTMMAVIGGMLSAEHVPHSLSTRVTLTLPQDVWQHTHA
ncbi:MAG: hypothetical protein AAGF95_18085 [Chloroflexota bacterium]